MKKKKWKPFLIASIAVLLIASIGIGIYAQFFIYTKYEVWCYEIKSGKRILLHGNLLYGKGGIKESGRWHHQKMCGCRSVDDIVKKIHEHEIWKYGGLEFK